MYVHIFIYTYTYTYIYIHTYIHAYDPSMVDCDAHWWNINPTAVQKDQKNMKIWCLRSLDRYLEDTSL